MLAGCAQNSNDHGYYDDNGNYHPSQSAQNADNLNTAAGVAAAVGIAGALAVGVTALHKANKNKDHHDDDHHKQDDYRYDEARHHHDRHRDPWQHAQAAKAPSAVCNGKSVRVSNGNVYVDGKRAKITVNNGGYIEAKAGGITYSITKDDVSWTGAHRANGVCRPSGSSDPAYVQDVPPAAKAAPAAPSERKEIEEFLRDSVIGENIDDAFMALAGYGFSNDRPLHWKKGHWSIIVREDLLSNRIVDAKVN